MQELTFEQVEEVSGGGAAESMCVGSFAALGALGGFIGAGIATGGIASLGGVYWGLGAGSALGNWVCLP